MRIVSGLSLLLLSCAIWLRTALAARSGGTILGLFPITGRDGSIGENRASGAMLALEWLRNDTQRISDGVPNNYTLDIVDTEDSKEKTLRRVFDRLQNRDVIGIIGASSSDVSAAVSTLASAMDVVQISYASSATELSDKEVYPLFCRVLPPNVQQINAVLSTLRYFGWSRVSVLSTSDAYASSLNSDFQTETARPEWRDLTVDLISSLAILSGEDNAQVIRDALQRLRSAQSRVVFLAATETDAKEILLAAYSVGMAGPGSGWVWLASDGWSQGNLLSGNDSEELIKAATGVLGVSPMRPQQTSFYRHWLDVYRNRKDHFESELNRTASCSGNNNNCTGILDGDVNLYSYFAFDSVYTLITGIDNMYKNDSAYFDSLDDDAFASTLVEQIKQLEIPESPSETTLQPVTGGLSFDQQCDRELPFDIVNAQINASTGQLEFMTVARWIQSGSRTLQRLPLDDRVVPINYTEPPNTALMSFAFADGTHDVPRGALVQPCAASAIAYQVDDSRCRSNDASDVDIVFAVQEHSDDGGRCDAASPGAVLLPPNMTAPCNAVNESSSSGVAVRTIGGLLAALSVCAFVLLLLSLYLPVHLLRSRDKTDLSQEQQLVLSAATAPRLRRHASRIAALSLGVMMLLIAPLTTVLGDREEYQCRLGVPLYTIALALCLAPLMLLVKTLDDAVRLPAELSSLLLATRAQRRRRLALLTTLVFVSVLLSVLGALVGDWEVAQVSLPVHVSVQTSAIPAPLFDELAAVFGEAFLLDESVVTVQVPRTACRIDESHAWVFLALPTLCACVTLLSLVYISLRCAYHLHQQQKHAEREGVKARHNASVVNRLAAFVSVTLIATVTVVCFAFTRHGEFSRELAARAEAPVHLAEVGAALTIAIAALVLLVVPVTWRTCANAKDVYTALCSDTPPKNLLERIDRRNAQMSMAPSALSATTAHHTADLTDSSSSDAVDETKRRTLAELATVLRDPVGYHFFLQFAASRYENETPQFWRDAKLLLKQLDDAACASPDKAHPDHADRATISVMVDGVKVDRVHPETPLCAAVSQPLLQGLRALLDCYVSESAEEQINVAASLRNRTLRKLNTLLDQARQQGNCLTPTMATEAFNTIDRLINETEVMMYTNSWREFQQSTQAGNASKVIAWTHVFFGLDVELQRAAIARLLWRGQLRVSSMRSMIDVAGDGFTDTTQLSDVRRQVTNVLGTDTLAARGTGASIELHSTDRRSA